MLSSWIRIESLGCGENNEIRGKIRFFFMEKMDIWVDKWLNGVGDG